MDTVAVVGAPVSCSEGPANVIIEEVWIMPVLAAWAIPAPFAIVPIPALLVLVVSGAVHP